MNKPLLNALRGKQPEVPPVWIMRQAGRFLPEYRAIRAENSFLDMCKTPELATEVTLLPVEKFDMDGAILFSDILIFSEAMGMNLEFIEGRGPVFHNPVRTREDVEALKTEGVAEEVGFVYETLGRLSKYLPESKTLIGFAGAPFTLACYMVEGSASRNYTYLKAMMYNDERSFKLLMEKLTTVLEGYLSSQIRAGAEAIQLFDTFGGVLSCFDYERYVFPYVKRIFNTLKGQFPGIPLIYFAKNGFGFFPLLQELKADCLGVDWSVSLTDAAARSGNRFILQGNMDPVVLFGGSDVIEREAKRVIEEGRKIKGHVFNLGHGILPETPVDSVRTLIEVIRCSQPSS
ncbi:MAG: uroporphyrinogen decarboxylase [Acidobacteria bacterium]|nr:uroporphyrinogen decarboxylase [Acidobacteriota bacterium]